jgi:hypothetical protein
MQFRLVSVLVRQLCWIAPLLVIACSTMDSVRDAPTDAGTVSSFAAPYDKVTAATLESLRSLRVEIVDSHEDSGGLVILVQKSLSMFSWGEVGRVIVERSSGVRTNVRVLWELRDHAQFGGTRQGEFSADLFNGIQRALASL